MFGEIIGAALAEVWKRAGAPDTAIFAELGPGRGTLAADALRVLRGAGFAGEVHLVESSPALRACQADAFPDAHWHNDLDTLPAASLLLVANEFFDALPVRQWAGGVERKLVAVGGRLAFDRDGTIVETSPAREAVMRALAAHLVRNGGVALVIDYGHAISAAGETLQAVAAHRFASVLERPGEQDLTAHVDFAALAAAARSAGATADDVVPQGEWLHALGIGARAAALATANPDRAADLASEVQRLTGRDEMGALFKVLAVRAPAWPAPAGFSE
jgi:SAM-dependent MidA family methyltransferase